MTHIATELPFLKSLLVKDTNNHYEISRMSSLLRDQPAVRIDIVSGCESVGHWIHYVSDRDYFVHVHGVIGSDQHCCHTSTAILLARADIYHNAQDLLDAVKAGLSRSVANGDLDDYEIDEYLADLHKLIVKVRSVESS